MRRGLFLFCLSNLHSFCDSKTQIFCVLRQIFINLEQTPKIFKKP